MGAVRNHFPKQSAFRPAVRGVITVNETFSRQPSPRAGQLPATRKCPDKAVAQQWSFPLLMADFLLKKSARLNPCVNLKTGV